MKAKIVISSWYGRQAKGNMCVEPNCGFQCWTVQKKSERQLHEIQLLAKNGKGSYRNIRRVGEKRVRFLEMEWGFNNIWAAAVSQDHTFCDDILWEQLTSTAMVSAVFGSQLKSVLAER